MNLYIQIKNNQPFEHPAFEENLLQAFGTVPEHWEPFVRVQCPVPTIYQNVDEEPTYQKINGVWTDNWNLRDMTSEEKLAKQQSNRDEFNRYVTYTTEGINSITNLVYDIDEINGFIHVTKFKTEVEKFKANFDSFIDLKIYFGTLIINRISLNGASLVYVRNFAFQPVSITIM
jgi:hypothetical protein